MNRIAARIRPRVALPLLALAVFNVARAECPRTRQVEPNDTLPVLADFYFGDRHFDSAILLATNSRIAEGFPFISDINNISKIAKVCIPEITEATRLRSRYEAYLRAIFDMALPDPWETRSDLVTFTPDREITVSTWVRSAQMPSLRDSSGKWAAVAPTDLWVTVEPHLRDFCSAFTAGHGKDNEQLTLRIEQHLGLPPASNKSKFVRIRLARPGLEVIFRPCMYPDTESTKCPVGPPPANVAEAHKNWIYHQYYSSYGQSRLSSYPWTSLGYTFDWSPEPHSDGDSDFLKYGESEFVIRKGAPIEIMEAVDTLDYCRSR